MHPAYSMLTPGLNWDPPSSLIGGEDLLARIYNAIRSSSSPTGSNYLNTTLLVTFDEHGGTYDHVAPPPAAPPDPAAPAGQFGFRFDRSGVRIPTLAISAWIPRAHRRQRGVPGHLPDLDPARPLEPGAHRSAPATPPPAASARSSRSTSHAQQSDWPDVVARPVEPMPESLMPLDAPLNGVGKALVGGVLALGKAMGATVPDVAPDAETTGAQAIAMLHDVVGDLFPAMRS